MSTIGTGEHHKKKIETAHHCDPRRIAQAHTLKVSGKTGVKEKAVMIKEPKPRNNTKRI